ncbi:MAG: DMT family transporter [Bacillota bacterium]|nr:DMT family transporter [Bacillota bacterium]
MKKSIFADFCLLLVALVWGSTFVLVQNAIDSLEPLSFNGVRFLVAAILLGFWLFLFERKQLVHFNKKMLASGVLMGFMLFLGYITQTMGLLYTTSSKAGFITGLSVVLVPLFSFFLLKQRPGKNAIIGVLIATVGLFLLTMTDVASLTVGDGLVFICAIAFGLHIILTSKFSGSYPSLLLTVIQISTVALFSIGSSFLFEDYKRTYDANILLSQNVLLALIVTSVFATALAFFAQTSFQKYTSGTRVALIFAMEPVFAAITGHVWAHEHLSASAMVGCALIFFGMVFAELSSDMFSFFSKTKQLAQQDNQI